MNIRAALLRSLLVIGFGAASALAQDPFAKPLPTVLLTDQPQIAIDVLMVSVPQNRALALLPKLRDAARLVGAETELFTMIAAKDGQFIGWPQLTAHAGYYASSEGILEARYPCEFEQPTEAQTFGVMPYASPAKKILNALRAAGLATPDTFEIRNSGCTLEMVAALSPDHRSATLRISPQWVHLARFERFRIFPGPEGEKSGVPQPIFVTHKTSVTATLRHGERRLIYVGKDSENPDRLTLFTMGMRIIPPLTAKN